MFAGIIASYCCTSLADLQSVSLSSNFPFCFTNLYLQQFIKQLNVCWIIAKDIAEHTGLARIANPRQHGVTGWRKSKIH